jgi:type 1 glutamine amidotransferase
MKWFQLAFLAFITLLSNSVAADPEGSPAELQWSDGTKVLVVGGGSSHDFQKWFNKADLPTIRNAGKFAVNYTENVATATKALPGVDVLVSSTNQRGFDTPEFRKELFAFADAGKGIVLLHPGLWYNWPWPEYNKVLAGGGARSHDALGPFEVNVIKQHPVTKGLPENFKVIDELYQVKQDPNGSPIEILAKTSTSGVTKKEHASIWIVKHPKARIVCIALGHDGRVHESPEYKTLLGNAVNWAAGK